jgi:cation:H+ antiporter
VSAWSVAAVVVGLVLLVGGAELLVRGASRLAVSLGISPLVVGLTVVAFGTSAPELAVGVQSAAAGRTELALGNVVGSNIFNTLAILGVSALIAELVVRQNLVKRELPMVVLASLFVFGCAVFTDAITRWQGALLVLAAIAYTVWAIRRELNEPDEVEAEYAEEVAQLTGGGRRHHWAFDVLMLLVGLGLLVLGARWLVDGASDIAVSLGMSELLVGVTIVAVGTSLPEAATSVVAAIRGERDIAVGNIVGSNLFNLLVVLGLTSLVSPVGVPVPATAMEFQLPALLIVSLLCVGVFYARWSVQRWEGVGFVLLYVIYVVDSVLESTANAARVGFRWFGVVVVVVFAVAVGVSSWRHYRRGEPPEPERPALT